MPSIMISLEDCIGLCGLDEDEVAAIAEHIASAQSYPTRPVRWIAPVAPGDMPDVLARLLCLGSREITRGCTLRELW
jgi:hypothetical protein